MPAPIDTKQHNDYPFLLALMALLFVAAPLYFQPNWGGVGLELTFNIAVWLAAAAFICITAYFLASRETLLLPRGYFIFCLAPIVVIVSGVLAGESRSVTLFFREVYLVGGLAFFFALFQYRLHRYQADWVLFLIACSTLLHATVAIFQLHNPELIEPFLPTNTLGHPTGIFQQRNVQAIYLVTGITITFYLISRPIARQLEKPHLLGLLTMATAASAYIIFYSSSRAGFIALVLALLLMGIARRKLLLRRKILLLVVICSLALGSYLGREGLTRVSDRTQDIAEGFGSSARLNIYAITLELIAEKPLTGHGVGSFVRVFSHQLGDYAERNPGAELPPYIKHPHNELAMWLIEGGLLAASGILLAVGVVAVGLFRCGLSRGGAYASMLLPITFHTQVEMPFYLSALHWFLWFFLIYLVLRHKLFTAPLRISAVGKRTLQLSAALTFGATAYFLVHSAISQSEMMKFLSSEIADTRTLQRSIDNHYFKPYAETLAMRATLYYGIQTDQKNHVDHYMAWSADNFRDDPRPRRVEDLISAYSYLGDISNRCRIARLGIRIYPLSEPLRHAAESCL